MNDDTLHETPLEAERYELWAEADLLETSRRDFLRIVGGGVVVALVLAEAAVDEAAAQVRGGRPGGRPREIGAWLHIGRDGAVTVYTGKVEVGQNIRTSLT